MLQKMKTVLEKAQHDDNLSFSELVALLSIPDEYLPVLMEAASHVREQNVGNSVHLRGIIEFSNYCSQQCCYCGLRAGHTSANRYRLTPEQILDTARAAARTGYRTLVLQSGEDSAIPAEVIADLTREIKKLDVAVTLSCGERSYEVYQQWREAPRRQYQCQGRRQDGRGRC